MPLPPGPSSIIATFLLIEQTCCLYSFQHLIPDAWKSCLLPGSSLVTCSSQALQRLAHPILSCLWTSSHKPVCGTHSGQTWWGWKSWDPGRVEVIYPHRYPDTENQAASNPDLVTSHPENLFSDLSFISPYLLRLRKKEKHSSCTCLWLQVRETPSHTDGGNVDIFFGYMLESPKMRQASGLAEPAALWCRQWLPSFSLYFLSVLPLPTSFSFHLETDSPQGYKGYPSAMVNFSADMTEKRLSTQSPSLHVYSMATDDCTHHC